jgi:hypothetical protein
LQTVHVLGEPAAQSVQDLSQHLLPPSRLDVAGQALHCVLDVWPIEQSPQLGSQQVVPEEPIMAGAAQVAQVVASTQVAQPAAQALHLWSVTSSQKPAAHEAHWLLAGPVHVRHESSQHEPSVLMV